MRYNSAPFILLIGIVIGCSLLLWKLDAKSFWCDELFTIRMAEGTPGQILTRLKADLHPPLYFLVIRAWAGIAGTGETALRLPSVLFALAGLWFTWRLGVQLVGRRAAQAGVIALACSPFFIEFSRMARYYSMTLAIGVLATLMFVKALERRRWQDWAGYGLASTLLLYTFYLSATLILAHGLYLLLDRESARSQRVRWLSTIIIVFLAFAAWLPILLGGQISRAAWNRADFAGSFSGLALSLTYPWYAFSVGETIFPWFPTAVPAALVTLGITGWWLYRSRLHWRGLIPSLILLPILLIALTIMLISTATPFLNVPVRGLFILPYFALALGAGWTSLPRLSWRITAALIIGVTWISSLFNYYTNQQFINPIYSTPAREVAWQVASQAGPDDVVIGEDDSSFPYYYLRAKGRAPYFEASQTETIIAYLTVHPVQRIWLVTIGRDGTRRFTPVKTMGWLDENCVLTLEQGYAEQDPTYRRAKQFLLHRPSYRYRLLVQRYERS